MCLEKSAPKYAASLMKPNSERESCCDSLHGHRLNLAFVLVSPGGLLRCLTQWRLPLSSFPPRLQPRPSTLSPYQSHLLPRLAFSLVSHSSSSHLRRLQLAIVALLGHLVPGFSTSGFVIAKELNEMWVSISPMKEADIALQMKEAGPSSRLWPRLTFGLISPSASSFDLISPSALSFDLISPSASSHLLRIHPPSACHRRFTSRPRLQHTWICDCKRVERNMSINIANEGGGRCREVPLALMSISFLVRSISVLEKWRWFWKMRVWAYQKGKPVLLFIRKEVRRWDNNSYSM